jgi:hypothetical protein
MERTENVERKIPDSAVLSLRTDGYENEEITLQAKRNSQFILFGV